MLTGIIHKALCDSALSGLSQPQPLPLGPLPSVCQPSEPLSAPQMSFAFPAPSTWASAPNSFIKPATLPPSRLGSTAALSEMPSLIP